ncbi:MULTISPECIES: acyltransferase family protein [unclassified Rhodococcus (in: high G+C Gram-positive bacteria)]|uniref:acyltransferase family protein n=1 Tax=unclassified Rhodococcus (in: high G+C Gram-positive bacteria) TaxID=192944 RepID=UPI0021C1186B|nr:MULTISPECIES: acyltransferase family protein [unclassified Rhodococcus (in: high G+C Gram-positive bacteria)]
MPMFFLLSGLFAAKWLRGSWRQLVQGKLAFLAWVYLVWTILEQPTKALAASYLQNDFSFPRQVFALALSPVRVPGVIWFLWALAVMFLFAKMTRNVDRRAQLALAAIVALAARCLPASADEFVVQVAGLGWRGVASYYAFFVAGAYWSDEIKSVVAGRVTTVTGGSAAATWVAVAATAQIKGWSEVGHVSFALAVLGAFAGIGASVMLSRVSALASVGRKTLPIYLVHYPLLIVLVVALDIVLGAVAVGFAIGMALALVATTVVASLLLYRAWLARYLFEPPAWWVSFATHVAPKPHRDFLKDSVARRSDWSPEAANVQQSDTRDGPGSST